MDHSLYIQYVVFPCQRYTWGFTKGSINSSINAAKRNDLYYAHDYSLFITPNICAKVLHFKAVIYKDIIISWSKEVEKDCDDPSSDASSKTVTTEVVVPLPKIM